MSSTGLQGTGYTYINTDDCWMLAERDANGNQVPDPARFPSGFQATINHVHSLGLKFGLYTSRSNKTCAGYAASCGYEAIDAANYAKWLVDYVKDDSCGSCRDTLTDYHIMQEAIWSAGRDMVLSIEGQPDVVTASSGGYGNMRRVGHDITSNWKSMVSLVDIASNLWPYARNDTNSTYGGWFNDLDMVEVGNGDFSATGNPDGNVTALIMSQAHMTMWSIMKAPLILGNDLSAMDAMTFSVLSNADAIAVNQDPLAVQARRVAVSSPSNSSVTTTPFDSVAVITPCSLNKPTQQWRWRNSSSGVRNLLYIVPCDETDVYQRWSFSGAEGSPPGLMMNTGTGQCLDAAAQYDPGMLLPCNASSPSQQWYRNASTNHVISTSPPHCLDVYMMTGPDVEMGSCKVPGANDANQQWAWNATTGQIPSLTTISGYCLAATNGPSGGQLVATDGDGNEFCLENTFGGEGGWGGMTCERSAGGGQSKQMFTISQQPSNASVVSIMGTPGPGWNNDFGASGPVAHSRYVTGYGWQGQTGSQWVAANYSALVDQSNSSAGSTLAADAAGIIDDDLLGHIGVDTNAPYCLDVSTMGNLEVWAGPLTAGRIAVAMFNRSPQNDIMTADWSDIGAASPDTAYVVRDVWAGMDVGTWTGKYSAPVPAHGVVFLILIVSPTV